MSEIKRESCVPRESLEITFRHVTVLKEMISNENIKNFYSYFLLPLEYIERRGMLGKRSESCWVLQEIP